MDCGAKSAGERANRAIVQDPPGPPSEGNALGGNRYPGGGESLFGNALSSGVGRAFYGGTATSTQCPSAAGARTSPGRNPECARGTEGRSGSHRQLGRKPLGRATRRSLRGASWSTGRNRTASGRLALAALPRSVSPPAPLPRTGAARCKSFRPTASRTYSTSSIEDPKECSSATSMADISIWQKTGHFYFALTASERFTDATPGLQN